MRNFFIALMMSFFVTGITAPVADAAKFGGGMKLGKTYSAPKKSSPAASTTQQKSSTAAAAGKTGLMGGLMGGLLAGGLLSALFFGGAFDGIQLMDVLLIAVVAFVLFKLFAGKKQAQAQPQYASAGGAQYRESVAESPETGQIYDTVSVDSLAQAKYATAETPAWFDKEAFVKGAQSHFENLQKAWDAQNWEEIASYTSPELLAELKTERAKHPADQKTEVVSVMADLFNFIDNQSDVVASVYFYGWIKENNAEPAEFGEVWHLTRDMTQPNADWFIVGLEQEQTS